ILPPLQFSRTVSALKSEGSNRLQPKPMTPLIRSRKMKTKKWRKALLITIGLGAVLLGTSAYTVTCELAAPGTMADPDFSGGPTSVTARKLITYPRVMYASNPMLALPAQAGGVLTERH